PGSCMRACQPTSAWSFRRSPCMTVRCQPTRSSTWCRACGSTTCWSHWLAITWSPMIRATSRCILLTQHYAYRQIPDTAAETTKAALHARAAGFFRQRRTPQENWQNITDLDPQLQEFHHLIQAHLYDQACALLNGIERSYLLIW